jgi:SHS2 domain-containing protein
MDLNKPDFTLLNHTADLGFIVRGTDLHNLFEQAAKSMMHIMIKSRPSRVTNVIKLSVDGDDFAELMVRWLGEILYLLEGEKEVVTDIGIDSISPSHLDATLKTVSFDSNLHEILFEIKAVTYHQIEVAEKGGYWEARVIFDL